MWQGHAERHIHRKYVFTAYEENAQYRLSLEGGSPGNELTEERMKRIIVQTALVYATVGETSRKTQFNLSGL